MDEFLYYVISAAIVFGGAHLFGVWWVFAILGIGIAWLIYFRVKNGRWETPGDTFSRFRR